MKVNQKCPLDFQSPQARRHGDNILAVMKRPLFFLSMALLPACAFSNGFAVSGSLDIDASFALIGQVAPGVSLTWHAERFGLGAEIDLPVDLSEGGTYMVALVVGSYGWLHIGLGVTTMLLPPADNGPYIFPDSWGTALKIGLVIPGWKAGPGIIGVDVFGEVFETATPGSGLGGAFLSVGNMMKVGIGLSYTVGPD